MSSFQVNLCAIYPDGEIDKFMKTLVDGVHKALKEHGYGSSPTELIKQIKPWLDECLTKHAYNPSGMERQ